MPEHSIYKDIAERTGGDIYIGVVGPVRTGKSTFIKKFMEETVIPNMVSDYDRERARDEIPQSAGGKTIMTTEPKFIPDQAVPIMVGDGKMSVKMIDCVGYMVDGAIGGEENGEIRMVMTPWFETPVSFDEAGEYGTKKVICDHSTIGVIVTTDGTIGELARENYADAEERVVSELKKIGKPFAIVLNSGNPSSKEAETLAMTLEEKYGAPVALVNCLELNGDDIEKILELILGEFPMREIRFRMPSWAGTLDGDHWLRQSLCHTADEVADKIAKVSDVRAAVEAFAENENTVSVSLSDMNLGDGSAVVKVELAPELYYRILGELTGLNIRDDAELFETMKDLAAVRREYEQFGDAIADVRESGYGIVLPDVRDMTLKEPEIVKQAGGYGVRLRASAASVHMIRAMIETEINPIVGTEQQSEELVKYMLNEFEEDPTKLWDTDLFGKSLRDLVGEGLHAKLEHITPDARTRLSETLSRVINEGSGGLVCIIL